MKKYLTIATIILIIISCSSCKSGTNTADKSTTDTELKTGPSNYDLLKQTDLNRIGDLSLGMTMAKTIEKLDKPDSKSTAEVWDADGWLHQDWEYNSKGISINMSGEKDSTIMEIFSITITTPCTFTTNKNIGIGNTYDEVMAVHKNEIDTTASDENVIIVGSLYGGIIFEFKNKKVIKIFVGAAAE